MGPRRRVSMGAAADGGGADTTPRELIQCLQRRLQALARLQVRPGDSELLTKYDPVQSTEIT